EGPAPQAVGAQVFDGDCARLQVAPDDQPVAGDRARKLPGEVAGRIGLERLPAAAKHQVELVAVDARYVPLGAFAFALYKSEIDTLVLLERRVGGKLLLLFIELAHRRGRLAHQGSVLRPGQEACRRLAMLGLVGRDHLTRGTREIAVNEYYAIAQG